MANPITINPAALLTLVPQTPNTVDDRVMRDRSAKTAPRVDPRAYSVSETSDAAWREALDQWRARRPAQ